MDWRQLMAASREEQQLKSNSTFSVEATIDNPAKTGDIDAITF